MGMILFFKSTLPHPGLHLETRRRSDGTEQGYWVADPEIKDAREVTYTINSVGRKWLKGRAPGKNYDVQIEINDRSRGWKPGDTVTFHARSEYKSSRFGSTTSVFPLTDEQEKAARVASKIGEIERWLGYVEEKAPSGYVYQKGVDTLLQLGVQGFKEYNDRLQTAIATATGIDMQQREAKAEARAAESEKISRGEITWLDVPYAEKDYAKAKGARWNNDERRWYITGDVPSALKRYVELPLPEVSFPVSGGSGYGYSDFVVGKVMLAPVGGVTQYIVPLRSRKRYFREDGLSFGVGEDTGYIYSADVRFATKDEIEGSDIYREGQRWKMRAASHSVALAASALIRKSRDAPEDARDLTKEGERLVIEENLYGGGGSFLIQKDWIWYLEYNGADGDDWSVNNLPGKIGWRIPRNEGLVDVLRLAAKVKDADLNDIGLVEEMENKFAAVRTDMSRPSRVANAVDSVASGPSEFAMRMLRKVKKPIISDATFTSIGQKLTDSVKWRRRHYDPNQLDMFAKSIGMVLLLRGAA